MLVTPEYAQLKARNRARNFLELAWERYGSSDEWSCLSLLPGECSRKQERHRYASTAQIRACEEV